MSIISYVKATLKKLIKTIFSRYPNCFGSRESSEFLDPGVRSILRKTGGLISSRAKEHTGDVKHHLTETSVEAEYFYSGINDEFERIKKLPNIPNY